METRIFWHGYSFKGKPDKVAEEIKSIGEDAKPDEIVAYARAHDKSELHKCFTWDNDKAAEKWRLHEARLIVNSLRIEVIEPKKQEPVKFRMFIKTDDETGYKETLKVIQNPDEYASMLERAKNELNAFKQKYKTLKELSDVFDAIDAL